MAEEGNKEALARQYLLGKLTDEDLTRLEGDFFADDVLFEEIEIAEDELVDAYVRRKLSSIDRKLFEEKLLVSERIAKRVEFADLLAKATSTTPQPEKAGVQSADTKSAIAEPQNIVPAKPIIRTPKSSIWNSLLWPKSGPRRFALATFGLILILGGTALILDWFRLRDESKRLDAQRAMLERQNKDLVSQNNTFATEADKLTGQVRTQEAEIAKLNDQLERQLNSPTGLGTVLPLFLLAGGSRGGSPGRVIEMPPRPATFEFRLLLETDDYPSYFAVVKAVDRGEIGQRFGLKARETRAGKVITVRFLSTRFVPGDYIVTVIGVTASGEKESIADYSFRVSASGTR